MLETFLSLAAPHHCSGCGEMGTLLCENCKYDITSEPFSACAACGKGLAGKHGMCANCQLPYQRAWCVAPRHDHLERLINNFKFTNAKAAYGPLGDLLNDYLPELPANIRIVPIPTVASHIRQRGYDHMFLVAKRLARRRRLSLDTSLSRTTNTMQRGAGARQRAAQAKEAFNCKQSLDPEAVYLLVDDVITTGSTMKYAAQTLLDAGATTVWVASISRQPLD